MSSDELVTLKTKAEQRLRPNRICICTAASCQSIGAERVHKALEAEVRKGQLDAQIEVRAVGCMGLCSAGPLVRVEAGETAVLYRNVAEQDALALTQSVGKAPVERLLCPTDVPFFARQHKIVLANCGHIHPERIEDYVAAGGY
jgi:bidirectional [NiFe] hydrogenase diaphorase subunit